MHRPLCFALLLLILLLATTLPADGATGSLAEVVGVLAKDVALYLEGKEKTLTIDSFRPDSSRDAHVVKRSSAGVAILEELKRQLARAGIKITADSKTKLDGTFLEVEDEDDQRQAIRLSIKLTDGDTGESVSLSTKFKHNYDVTNEADLGHITGVPLDYPAGGNARDRIKAQKEAIDRYTPPNNPRPAFDGNRILAGTDSKFAIEVHAARAGTKAYAPRRPFDDKGFAAVKIDPNEIYAVKLINNADFEAAVSLSIDGLSMFIASDKEGSDPKTKQKVVLRNPETNRPLYHHVLVPARQSVTIVGWFINLSQTDEFKVTEYAKSMAAEVRSTAPTGQIVACFHAAVPEGQLFPPGEPADKTHAHDAHATGRGARRGDIVYSVVERKIGGLRAVASVRYSKSAR